MVVRLFHPKVPLSCNYSLFALRQSSREIQLNDAEILRLVAERNPVAFLDWIKNKPIPNKTELLLVAERSIQCMSAEKQAADQRAVANLNRILEDWVRPRR